jgi:hypothetical protein
MKMKHELMQRVHYADHQVQQQKNVVLLQSDFENNSDLHECRVGMEIDGTAARESK